MEITHAFRRLGVVFVVVAVVVAAVDADAAARTARRVCILHVMSLDFKRGEYMHVSKSYNCNWRLDLLAICLVHLQKLSREKKASIKIDLLCVSKMLISKCC